MKQMRCLVCGGPIDVRPARGRKSHKPFIMLVCSRDGRHFRAFINDQEFVARVMGAGNRSRKAGEQDAPDRAGGDRSPRPSGQAGAEASTAADARLQNEVFPRRGPAGRAPKTG